MLQSKDMDWLNGYKNKTHIYAIYKTTHYKTESEGMEKILHASGNQKNTEVAIHISEKIK